MTIGKATGNFKTQFTVELAFAFLQVNKHNRCIVILSTTIAKKAKLSLNELNAFGLLRSVDTSKLLMSNLNVNKR